MAKQRDYALGRTRKTSAVAVNRRFHSEPRRQSITREQTATATATGNNKKAGVTLEGRSLLNNVRREYTISVGRVRAKTTATNTARPDRLKCETAGITAN